MRIMTRWDNLNKESRCAFRWMQQCVRLLNQAVWLFLQFGTMLSHHTFQEFLSESRLTETSCCTPALTQRPQPACILHTWAQSKSKNTETFVGDDLKISDKGPETEEMGRSQDPNQCFLYLQNRRQSEPRNVTYILASSVLKTFLQI